MTVIGRWLPWALLAAVAWGVWGFVAARARVEGGALRLVAVVVAVEAVMLAPLLPLSLRSLSWPVVATAVAGAVAYIAFFQAFRRGGPAGPIVGVSALYPAVTLVLASVLERHRPSVREVVGIALAVAAVIALGTTTEMASGEASSSTGEPAPEGP